ncbi:MAG: alpha-amylase family glycosyl hydrolase [Verrucomicrobia bacterium]|nr:alpha-amylase family glycosyl hydrolase [Verrucomicrobiota bacterium]
MPHPLLYEINTRCWLRALSEESGTSISLANVPDSEFAGWRKLGFTHIWLMGVWTTGPHSRAEALQSPELRRAYEQVLPGWQETDIAGSPYAIGNYRVPPALGGEAGLAAFRQRLHEHGMKLLLDFVPNHVGLDHPWLSERPDLFVQSPSEVPGTIRQSTGAGSCWLAQGKDPYFAPWTDTVQLDYRRPATRAAMMQLLQAIAGRCDGVRCDMAMLVLNEVFLKTWERFQVSVPPPATEFWASAIAAIQHAHPGFLFLAEAYWGMEAKLRSLGFNYTYDKTLYDGLISRDNGGVQRHLLGINAEDIAGSAHFLENHDEPRIASMLSPAEHRVAALLILGLPGMRFLHDGQLSGALRKIPVQLARRALEPSQAQIASIYQLLLTTLRGTAVGQGRGELLKPRAAWPDNATAQNFVIVQWQNRESEFELVAANLAPHRSQCYVPLNIPHLAVHNWAMNDLLGQEFYKRSGEDLQNQGLYLDLPPHGAQLFRFEPIN